MMFPFFFLGGAVDLLEGCKFLRQNTKGERVPSKSFHSDCGRRAAMHLCLGVHVPPGPGRGSSPWTDRAGCRCRSAPSGTAGPGPPAGGRGRRRRHDGAHHTAVPLVEPDLGTKSGLKMASLGWYTNYRGWKICIWVGGRVLKNTQKWPCLCPGPFYYPRFKKQRATSKTIMCDVTNQ